MHTVQVLNNLVENNQTLAYLVVFLGLIFEGEIVVISAGVLAQLGALSFWPALIFILLGGFTKIIILYYFGSFLQERYNHKNIFQYLEKRVLSVLPRFKEKPFWSLFISKFIMGVDYIVIIFAGYKRINLKTYYKAEISGNIIWASLLLSVGYFFSQTALSVTKELWKFSLLILLLVIGFILFDKIVAWVYGIFGELYDNPK